jgi:hypothetical protein
MSTNRLERACRVDIRSLLPPEGFYCNLFGAHPYSDYVGWTGKGNYCDCWVSGL